MALNGNDITALAREGRLDLAKLRTMLGESLSDVVTVTDWGVSYDSGTGQLSEYATVTTNNAGDPITGIGMLAYSGNGVKLYSAQYTNGFSSEAIATSIGTGLYAPQDGNQALCVVYGWTENASFYFTQIMTIQTQ